MTQRYCGDYWKISNCGVVMGLLFEAGVPIYYRHVWRDEVRNRVTKSAWALAENIADLHTTGKKPEDSSWLMKYDMEVAFDIPDDKYPLLMARQNQEEREFAERFERVRALPTPEWALHEMSEGEKGWMYDKWIAPEKGLGDDLYNMDGEFIGERK